MKYTPWPPQSKAADAFSQVATALEAAREALIRHHRSLVEILMAADSGIWNAVSEHSGGDDVVTVRFLVLTSDPRLFDGLSIAELLVANRIEEADALLATSLPDGFVREEGPAVLHDLISDVVLPEDTGYYSPCGGLHGPYV